MKGEWKVVKQDEHNSDQYLLGFYKTKDEALDARLSLQKQCPHWITSWKDLVVKLVDPEKIESPVCTDFEHYLRWLIPNDEWERVMNSDASAEIDCNNMTCGRGTYYYLSRMIPKDWTVIDIGCAYNPQSYLFQNHALHIAIEPVWNDKDFHFEYFKAPNTELLFMTGQEFIQKELPKMNLDLDKTFAIVNFVPSGACNLLARETFKNIYTYYPA